ncbi:MAG: 30S ribosomal protein S14 [Legionellales bacterium]|nr:30S ribosomal protein S14 [Legionellales bacterium]
MAKKSIKERELKRELLVKKFAPLRDEIKKRLSELYALLVNTDGEHTEVYAEIDALQRKYDLKVPRNATVKRLRNRCRMTGRGRGVYRKFRLGRSMLREAAMMGLVPGVRKSSW